MENWNKFNSGGFIMDEYKRDLESLIKFLKNPKGRVPRVYPWVNE